MKIIFIVLVIDLNLTIIHFHQLRLALRSTIFEFLLLVDSHHFPLIRWSPRTMFIFPRFGQQEKLLYTERLRIHWTQFALPPSATYMPIRLLDVDRYPPYMYRMRWVVQDMMRHRTLTATTRMTMTATKNAEHCEGTCRRPGACRPCCGQMLRWFILYYLLGNSSRRLLPASCSIFIEGKPSFIGKWSHPGRRSAKLANLLTQLCCLANRNKQRNRSWGFFTGEEEGLP